MVNDITPDGRPNLLIAWLARAGARRPRLLREIRARFHDIRQTTHMSGDQCDVGARLGAAMLEVLARDHQISLDELRSLVDHPDRLAAEAVARLALQAADTR